ncbi:MAG: response regulator transcription factor [Lachnospiraceae bacterium]|nr:response regulator transcription factor [Lachnospiraceae bacterium]
MREDLGKRMGEDEMRIAVCDDEIGTCSEIETMILDFAEGRGLQVETEVFYSGETLYPFVSEYDLIFLDILLLEMDGVRLGQRIREELGNETVSIVYISSKESYAMSLFSVRPLDFLIKPITREKLNAVLTTYLRLRENGKNEFLFKVGKSLYRQYLEEIRYFACNGKKVELSAISGTWEFYGNMREVWRQVEGKGFLAIHKSYVVNTAFVAVYHYDSVELSDGSCLPVSQRYRKIVREHLMAEYGGRI